MTNDPAALPARALVPMAHVRNVAASLAFYRRLGFEVENTFIPSGQAEPSWASLECGRARLMIALADGPLAPGAAQGVLFYAYFDDVPGIRERLAAEGVAVGPISFPFYAPRGEFRIEDPDGYVVMVTHT